MNRYTRIIIATFMLMLASCIVQSPKYTSLDQVMSLKTGMSKKQVEEVLGIEPYDLKSHNDSTDIFIYVYRVIDRKTLSVYTRPKNGRKSEGKYVQLQVTYSKGNKVVGIESCNLCPDNLVNYSKIDVGKIFAFITVSLPVVLVYLGLR